jgi:transcriptional regulator with XRE-family HTH domain
MIPPMTDEQEGARRLAEALRRRLAQTGVSLSQVDRRLEWAEGTLSELLSGNSELRVKELLAVLRTAGIEERVFFAELYDLEPRCRATSGQGEIPYSIGHLSAEDAPAFPPTEEVLALFRELVGDAVRRDLRPGEAARAGAPGSFEETDLLDGHHRGD